MRIPPYHEEPGWQRFFVGMFFGALLSWLVFLYLFGQLQDKQLELIAKQRSTISELEDKVDIWEQEYQDLNEKNKKSITVQEIEVYLLNEKELKLDSLASITLKNAVMNELKYTINKNIETIADNKHLLIQAIENKIYKIDNQQYQLKVNQLYLFTTMEVYLQVRQLS